MRLSTHVILDVTQSMMSQSLDLQKLEGNVQETTILSLLVLSRNTSDLYGDHSTINHLPIAGQCFVFVN
jgi:hypothetical protein